MNKRQIHHYYKNLKWVRPWHFLVLALVSGLVCVFALRANNQQMIELRQAVYSADKEGSDVQQPLKELQAYVTSHMNTSLNSGQTGVYPPIQLKYTYERLVAANNDAFARANSQLYTEAQAHCERANPSGASGGGRIPCIQEYVQTRSTAKPAPIPDALYKFSFVSPKWSPDLAGISMLIAILSGLTFVITFIGQRWFKRYLR